MCQSVPSSQQSNVVRNRRRRYMTPRAPKGSQREERANMPLEVKAMSLPVRGTERVDTFHATKDQLFPSPPVKQQQDRLKAHPIPSAKA